MFFFMLLLSTSCTFLCSHFQVAIIAGNFDLAEIVKVHKASDVGKLTEVVTSELGVPRVFKSKI